MVVILLVMDLLDTFCFLSFDSLSGLIFIEMFRLNTSIDTAKISQIQYI